MKNALPKPIVLIILDGWGVSDTKEHNAISLARTPTWNKLWATYPHTTLAGSGEAVGLPANQMGNSEVGHITIGAGRVVHQELTRIDQAASSGEFAENKVLLKALTLTKKQDRAIHVMGLFSPGGVHSHENHFVALLKLAAEMKTSRIYFHLFLDGRDTPPKSAQASIEKLERACKRYQCGKIVSMIGRYYAMDRDNRWDRVATAYALLVEGKAVHSAATPNLALKEIYRHGETDEFAQATSIHPPNESPVTIADGDAVIFMNFRADRARELTQAFIEPSFSHFPRQRPLQLSAFVCLTEYDAHFKADVAFPPSKLRNIFAEYVSQMGLKQLRIAETEKYAHVTFFFNGGVEKPFANEKRILIPSPKVTTYDLQPEMSAPELTHRLVQELRSNAYDVIICNFANPDMVGHTGNLNATIKAIETIDVCLTHIVEALEKLGGELIITADHGNAEKMHDSKNNQPHTAHTTDPVPFIYMGREATITHNNGNLSDIAPTLLYLMGLPIPAEMTGKSLVKLV